MRFAAAALLAALAAGPVRARALPEDLRCPGCGVLLITLDLLRSDVLAAQGGTRGAMPNLDALAARGALFLNAYSPSPHTQPAEVSLMTGLYPWRHGLSLPRRDESALASRTEGLGSLAGVLKAAGYHVARASFPREEPGGSPAEGVVLPEGVVPGGRFLLLVDHKLHDPYLPPWRAIKELDAEASPDDFPTGRDVTLCALASALSRRVPAGASGLRAPPPEILFRIDRLEPEASRILSAPEPRERLRAARGFDPLQAAYLLSSQCYWSFFSSSTIGQARLMYDAKARFIDERLGGFLKDFERRGFLERTLVVVASQHGDEFLEHGRIGHDQLYAETTRVPLLLVFPGAGPARIVSETVSLVDVAPTVLEALGIPAPGGLDGKSLIPCLEGGCGGRLAFAQWGESASARDDRYTYLLREDGSEALFDRSEDPGERRDISGRAPEDLARLREALRRARAEAGSRRRPDEKARREVLRHGYW